MFVKIVKCSNAGWWYSGYIGRTFEVRKDQFNSGYYKVIGSGSRLLQEIGGGYNLYRNDCAVVDKPRSMKSEINYTRRVRCL